MENNKLIDGWTPVHIGAGLITASLTKDRKQAYRLIIGFEVLEKLFLEGIFRESEGVKNIISDLIFGIGAFEIARSNS